MKIYISSTFVDLEHYRAAVANGLRRLGHRIIQMEEYTAEESLPIDRCVRDVKSADVYVGIFAWRYGYVPVNTVPFEGLPTSYVSGETSITEAEYLAAEGKTRLIFLMSDTFPWSPKQMDAHTSSDGGKKIKEFRNRLGEKHVVSFFTTVDNLTSEVMAAPCFKLP